MITIAKIQIVAAISCLVVTLGLTIMACNPTNNAGVAIPVSRSALYNQMCASCHGADGKGNPAMKSQMPVGDFSSAIFLNRSTRELEAVIMQGRNKMPGFGGSLSPAKIQALVGYTKNLGRLGATRKQ